MPEFVEFFRNSEDLQTALRQQSKNVRENSNAEVCILLAITPVADLEGARRISDKLKLDEAVAFLKSEFDKYDVESSVEYRNAPIGMLRATDDRWFNDAQWQQELVLKLRFTKNQGNT